MSILSEQVETRHLTPERAVQRMLDLCNEFGHKLERNRSQKHQVEFLIRHTAKLTTLLQSAHKEFLLVNVDFAPRRCDAFARNIHFDFQWFLKLNTARLESG